ncbi:phosphocholine cytidylyltransferase family protein [Legionella spiritensis]|uniref:Nucleotidyltransferase n=1 Tax=Legionella spiritensis TaxID=452 RepID=A0A0W0YYR5_LEGSP|nr:phosphocholine cytidylyltransferase family protein [Legionella spiritensis]KTD62007.1 nucleotidyltransferase [Legionella spiritensis]SNV34810.1 nucleotidyltransferase [Legionella spiritensis]
MRAIILAAGRGSRMGKLTDEQPKCLTVVNGRPLIEHQINALTEAGIKEIAIVTGYRDICLQKYGNHFFHNEEWAQTNMVWSLMCARPWLDEDNCIVSYSDIFYGSQIVQNLISCDDDIAIAYDPNWYELWSKRFANPLDDAETFRLDERKYLVEIGRKTDFVADIQGQYMGLLKFNKNTLSHYFMDNTVPFTTIDMTSFLQHLIVKQVNIKAVANFEAWGEIDHPEDIAVC